MFLLIREEMEKKKKKRIFSLYSNPVLVLCCIPANGPQIGLYKKHRCKMGANFKFR